MRQDTLKAANSARDFDSHALNKRRLFSEPTRRFFEKCPVNHLLALFDGWGAVVTKSPESIEMNEYQFRDAGGKQYHKRFSLPQSEYVVKIGDSEFHCDHLSLFQLAEDMARTRAMLPRQVHRKFERFLSAYTDLRQGVLHYEIPYSPEECLVYCTYRQGSSFAVADFSEFPDMRDGVWGAVPFEMTLPQSAVFTAIFDRATKVLKSVVDLPFFGVDRSHLPFSKRFEPIPEYLKPTYRVVETAKKVPGNYYMDSEQSYLTLSGISVYTDSYPVYLLKDAHNYFTKPTARKKVWKAPRKIELALCVVSKTGISKTQKGGVRYEVLKELLSTPIDFRDSGGLTDFATDLQFRRFGFNVNEEGIDEGWQGKWQRSRKARR
jgi:hypothetical protein